jgi:hypothetical protein
VLVKCQVYLPGYLTSCSLHRNCLRFKSIPYNLEDRTMVLHPVPRPGDMIGRGLVLYVRLV